MIIKNFTLTSLFSILICSLSMAQDTVGQRDSLLKNTDFEVVSARAFSFNSNAPQTGLLINFSKRPVVKGSVPILQGNMSALFIDASVGSNNDAIPLFEKGKWATNASGALSYTLFLNRDNVYSADAAVSKAAYTDASKMFWMWLNAKAGYNFASYLLYNDLQTTQIDREISRKNYNNLFGQANVGFYIAPFESKMSWLAFTGNVGFEYRQNDNNYQTLQTVMVKSFTERNDAQGNAALEVTSEESAAKKGKFVVANSANVNYNLTFLISPKDQYTVGLNVFGRTRLAEQLKSTDLGFGINVPVQRIHESYKRTLVNLALNYEIIDIGNKLQSNLRLSDKGYLSLTVAVPIYTRSY